MLKAPPCAQENKIATPGFAREFLVFMLISQMKFELAHHPIQIGARREKVLVQSETLLALITDLAAPSEPGERTPFVAQHEIIKIHVLAGRCRLTVYTR